MKTKAKTTTGYALKAGFVVLSFGLTMGSLQARENLPGTGGNGEGHKNANWGNNSVMANNCQPGKTKQEISLNNVRTLILTDGDMWWDYAASIAKYEIPKGSNSYSMFAGSLWFGGYVGTDLRVGAMTYRQNGFDFWPGPLNPVDLSTNQTICQAYDKVWQFNRQDVVNFYAYWNQYHTADPSTPTWIKDYPGNSDYMGAGVNVNIPASTLNGTDPLATTLYNSTLANAISPMNYLAPYYDMNGDGTYNYATGDYPAYNINPNAKPVPRGHCVRFLFGDVTNFFVFNDNGNKHTETGSVHNIGVEIRGQAFEFATSDELNDMSFYNYEIINWSSNILTKTYFSVWNDCDLGYYLDDYVGCDVSRGLGYQYNGENYDPDANGQIGYHDKLPAIGCDFFQGPYADIGDSIDNDRDGCVDCSWSQCPNGTFACPPAIADNDPHGFPEQCVMSRFTYYNNQNGTINGNPSGAQAYYNLMNGVWEIGAVPMTYGNLGLNAVSAANPACKFLFPGTSDPQGWTFGYKPSGYRATSAPGTPIAPPAAYPNWTEYNTPGDAFGDRRFLQSAGPFTLQPGAVNYVTFGLPWARSNTASFLAPIPMMLAADDKAQALFDNCFKVLDGPDAPDLTIQELNQQLLITLTNNPYTSNNYEANRYADIDPNITAPSTFTGVLDKVYRFQGYKIYQLVDQTVSVSDLYNTDRARLVFQCDIKDGVSQLINYNSDPTLGTVPQLMVSGADAGIQNSFSLNTDLFAVSNKTLVNFKTYYFMAVAYAYNNFLPYKPTVSPTGVATPTVIGGTATTVVVYNDPSSGDMNGQKKPYLQGRNNVKLYSAIPHNPSVENNGTIMNSSYGAGMPVTRIEGQGNGGNALYLTDQSVQDILNAPNGRAQNITYQGNGAPVYVKVVDPLRIVKGNFTIRMVTATANTSNTGVVSWYYNGNPPVASTALIDTGKVKNSDTIKWYMTGSYTDLSGNQVTKTWLSDEGLRTSQEKIITGLNNESLGFSVSLKQVTDPQVTARYFLWSSPAYAYGQTLPGDLLASSLNSTWLSGVQDVDGTPQNWILSGTNKLVSPFDINETFPIVGGGGKTTTIFGDPGRVWSGVCGGTWAPFRFVNPNASYPGFLPVGIASSFASSELGSSNNLDTRLLSSVDVVLTADQTKWTRCPVVDMAPNSGVTANIDPATGISYKWQLRHAASVDKFGRKNGDAGFNSADGLLTNDSSMSWFPGYAINVETGERLNIVFGENSMDSINNGRDMLWNPTATYTNSAGTVVNGGMHYIYVLGHNADGNFTFGSDVVPSDVRRYDAGASSYQMLRGMPASISPNTSWPQYNSLSVAQRKNKWGLLAEFFKDVMWVSMPLSSVDLSKAAGGCTNIPSDAKVQIRVPKPFRYGLSTVASPAVTSVNIPSSSNTANLSTFTMTPLSYTTVAGLPSDVATTPQNGNFPMYSFSTASAVASIYQAGTAKAALAMINIVPNPYYSHDVYETTRIDLRVKIINLPVNCTISIYTLSGTLIRVLQKDNSDTYLDWDLHNSANIQIASGLYILHVDAPGIGTRTLKWFGVMRPYDLQSY